MDLTQDEFHSGGNTGIIGGDPGVQAGTPTSSAHGLFLGQLTHQGTSWRNGLRSSRLLARLRNPGSHLTLKTDYGQRSFHRVLRLCSG